MFLPILKKLIELNRDYRDKDYPVDIITFAILQMMRIVLFLTDDINLGEIIIALDKVIEGVNRDISRSANREQELFF